MTITVKACNRQGQWWTQAEVTTVESAVATLLELAQDGTPKAEARYRGAYLAFDLDHGLRAGGGPLFQQYLPGR